METLEIKDLHVAVKDDDTQESVVFDQDIKIRL